MRMKLSANIKAITPEQKQDYQTGMELGQKAYQNDLKRVPIHDADLRSLVNPRELGESFYLLKGWLEGWDNENRIYVMNLLHENAVL